MEAIGTHTLNIVYPGEYSGVLLPEFRATLEDDHSNLGEVLEQIHEEGIRERAREYMMERHTYKHRVADILALATGGAACRSGISGGT